ncbi:MAG: hypothetical protein Q8S15_08130 [Erysipelotrichaceae bacterium]|nr:hypothetical protein [Erysipelotrichaceae bacterium]
MKKFLKITFCFLIFGTALIPLFGTVIGVDSLNLDKSALSPMPALIENNKINAKYTSQFDDFYTDQFSFRTYLITAYNQIYAHLFKQSGNDKVIVGKEGFLFFEETLNDYLKVDQLSDYDLLRLNEVLRIQQKYLQLEGIESHFIIVPNKATIYPEFMLSLVKPIGSQSNLERISEMELNMSFIDLKEELIKQKMISANLLYHHQDSHWNNIGAAIGYDLIMKFLNKESLVLTQQPYENIVDWQGDLARMLYPSKSTLDQQFYFKLPSQFTFTKAIRTLEDLQIESVNASKEGSLFMFRDSFANALIPFISESFEQVNYSRLFPYDYTKIDTERLEHLIIEIAERNVNWLLQATPILQAIGEEISITETSTVSLDITVDQEKKSDLFYLNARFMDQKISEKITAVRLMDGSTVYEVFPIYQDTDFEDEILEKGFSIYTKEELNPDTMTVYVFMNNEWFKVE